MTEAGLSSSSEAMLAVREQVISVWAQLARQTLCKAGDLPDPILLNTLPLFYERLARLLTPEFYRASGVDVAVIAQEHGGERARLSGYDTTTLIREYQLFRQTLFRVLHQGGIVLTHEQREAIATSIDSAIRESVTAFALIQSALREQFIAALTHDLRTPLSTIAMAAQVLGNRAPDDDIRKLAERISANAQRIEAMTRDLLDCMVFEGGERLPLHIEEFDLSLLAYEVAQQAMDHGSAQVLVEFEPVVGHWCRASLQRALENLLGNAIKYSTPGTPIRLQVLNRDERVHVEVHNEGEPIPPEHMESIFQVYRRARHGPGSKDGWGVGLPYARRVAESHGGSIIVTSTAEQGTTFLLAIPLDARPFSNAPVSG
ncbi:sensor histidine kinase [Pseudoduganella sp. DS3]|uniref:histidine kinase n=1 Tax=Pseudoduganella guangdongensis TaxID=2692179 RepID=A0A6N9HGS2_9BURK|nr:HAMP domain-containing sensor histidine kinase [Pseudoduganella guangdongensis]MYN02559.1 sensor histidine kinase [Pseudoduganella guangdongensis]